MLNIELKFRGFNKKTRKLYRSGALSFSTERHSFMMYSDKDMDGVKDDDIEIMQYTGQKDVNNKEFSSKEEYKADSFFELTGDQFGELVSGTTKIRTDVINRQNKIDPGKPVVFFPELMIYTNQQ